MNTAQEKVNLIAEMAIRIAHSISEIHKSPINHLRLTQKRIFPNRKMPHPLRRKLKREALLAAERRNALTAATVGVAALHTAVIMETPLPKYEQGGKCQSVVFEYQTNPLIGYDTFFILDNNDIIHGRKSEDGKSIEGFKIDKNEQSE